MSKTLLAITWGVFMVPVLIGCQPKKASEEKDNEQTDISDAFAIEILSEEALEVINPDSKIRVLASGFTWTEGPLWIEEGGYLLFSDIPNNKVYKLEANGDTSTFLHPSGYTGEGSYGGEPGSNALVLSPEGDLVLLQHGDRRVARMNAPLSSPISNYISLVDNYNGEKFNSPNDGVFDREGNFYFTDPPYGLPLKMEDPGKELDFQGVYCRLATGEVRLLDQLTRPNGITISEDGQKLYVAVSDPELAVWYEYDILEPGKVGERETFYDATHLVGKEGQQGLPDGMKMHSKGLLFATGPGGIWIFNRHSRQAVARIYTGQLTSNCAFSADKKRLFLTADDHILEVELI